MSDVRRSAQSAKSRSNPTIEGDEKKRINSAPIAVACGIAGVVAAVWAYWMILPGLVLGAVAVVLGWRNRGNGNREGASVAIALGLTAILLVPSVLVIADQAESWGRDCALDPTSDPHC